MVDVTVVRYSYEGEKFEILVKPDPALDFKLGKKKDISAILISDEIYTDSGKGTKPSTEKLLKAFKTEDVNEIAEIMLRKGDLNLTTDQRRKMLDEKRKQIVDEQVKDIVEKLRSIIPLKSENLDLEITIPAQYASQSYAVLKSVGFLKKEEWQNNGSLKAILEIPAGARPNVIDRLGSITKGSASIEVAK